MSSQILFSLVLNWFFFHQDQEYATSKVEKRRNARKNARMQEMQYNTNTVTAYESQINCERCVVSPLPKVHTVTLSVSLLIEHKQVTQTPKSTNHNCVWIGKARRDCFLIIRQIWFVSTSTLGAWMIERFQFQLQSVYTSTQLRSTDPLSGIPPHWQLTAQSPCQVWIPPLPWNWRPVAHCQSFSHCGDWQHGNIQTLTNCTI